MDKKTSTVIPALGPFIAALIAALCMATLVIAQPFPSRPVRVVVPTSAGGATDAFARALAQRLAENWGQTTVVENRPGAEVLQA